MVRWVNEERSKAGRPALTQRDDLSNIARNWSNKMVAAGGLSHQNQTQVMNSVGGRAARENVGQSTMSARHVFDSFMNSATHKDNILANNVSQIGVGCVQSGSTWWVTQTFVG